MALHRLTGIDLGVPEPDQLDSFYQEIGLTGGNRSWGPEGLPGQIRVSEAPYRQLRQLRIACETEADLDAISKRLTGMGIDSKNRDGELRVMDPINDWEIVVAPSPIADVPTQPKRTINRPGERPRTDRRHELLTETTPRAPRRIGHVVVGSTDPGASVRFYVDGLGFRVSDNPGPATFLRCSPDHHNLLITPGPVPHLNHYALEHDDIDAACYAATRYLAAHEDRQIAGPGRHPIGGNMFWYMRDPSGNYFEFFADMDRILDDESWVPRSDWPEKGSWAFWGAQEPPEVFFNPIDMPELIAGWNKAHS